MQSKDHQERKREDHHDHAGREEKEKRSRIEDNAAPHWKDDHCQSSAKVDDMLDGLNGSEHFLVGLSPSYWARVPMMVGQVHALRLINGIDCRIPGAKYSGHFSTSLAEPPSGSSFRCLPLSKCELVGYIVCLDIKSNGSTLFVLDDGTGLIDCVDWSTDESSIHALPPLVPSSHAARRFDVGDLVRVQGRIRVVKIGPVVEERLIVSCNNRLRSATTDNVEISVSQSQATDTVMMRSAVREIVVTFIEKLCGHERTDGSCDRSNTESNMLAETHHWLQALKAEKESLTRSNGVEVLAMLGPTIAQQALDRMHLPSADDSTGAWRLFGQSCKCGATGTGSRPSVSLSPSRSSYPQIVAPYKDSLLYCHCIATKEPLDPCFRFRDAVLICLLEMESQVVEISQSSVSESSVSSPMCPLHFQFKKVVNHPAVRKAAKDTIESQPKTKSIDVRRLESRTFSHLRNDGIIHLVDADSDSYTLLSRERVLEPYMRKLLSKDPELIMERKVLMEQPPDYLESVPNARIQFVKRCVQAEIASNSSEKVSTT